MCDGRQEEPIRNSGPPTVPLRGFVLYCIGLAPGEFHSDGQSLAARGPVSVGAYAILQVTGFGGKRKRSMGCRIVNAWASATALCCFTPSKLTSHLPPSTAMALYLMCRTPRICARFLEIPFCRLDGNVSTLRACTPQPWSNSFDWPR